MINWKNWQGQDHAAAAATLSNVIKWQDQVTLNRTDAKRQQKGTKREHAFRMIMEHE